MRRSRENQVKATLRAITKIRNDIYKEFERQEKCKNDEFERESDSRIQDMLHKIKMEADAMFWAI